MATKTLPDRAYLIQCLDYDHQTGSLTWRHRPRDHFPKEKEHRRWNTRYAGTSVGYPDHKGYLTMKLDYITMRVARVIFKIMTGEEPEVVDHKNLMKADNKWDNLRSATNSDNACNKPAQKGCAVSLKGVHMSAGRIHSQIMIKGKIVNLGYFETAEAAHKAYCEAAIIHHGEFWNPG